MSSASKIILGTVQFGMHYGINNSSGKPVPSLVFEMLDFAYENGITMLDTANAYGDAELILGQYFEKTGRDRFNVCSKFSETGDVKKTTMKTLETLNLKNIFGFSFHNYTSFKGISAKELDKLIDLKKSGAIKNIGVSIYTNEQLNDVINSEWIDLIQLPFNLLDRNSEKTDLLLKAKHEGKIIHTRSVFLQGLFYKDIEALPEKLIPLRPYLARLRTIASENELSIAELALNYAVQNPLIDNIVIGVDNLQQLKQNLAIIKTISRNVITMVDEINVKEEHLLNPVNWN